MVMATDMVTDMAAAMVATALALTVTNPKPKPEQKPSHRTIECTFRPTDATKPMFVTSFIHEIHSNLICSFELEL